MQAKERLQLAGEPDFASGQCSAGSRGLSHSHSSVHSRRKGKSWKTKTQTFLRSSHFPLPVYFGSAGGVLKEMLRAAY